MLANLVVRSRLAYGPPPSAQSYARVTGHWRTPISHATHRGQNLLIHSIDHVPQLIDGVISQRLVANKDHSWAIARQLPVSIGVQAPGNA